MHDGRYANCVTTPWTIPAFSQFVPNRPRPTEIPKTNQFSILANNGMVGIKETMELEQIFREGYTLLEKKKRSYKAISVLLKKITWTY